MASGFALVLNMSLTASIIICLILTARLCLSKQPKIYSYVLWSAVLFRLLCPVSISLPVSILAPFSDASSPSSAAASTMEYISVQSRRPASVSMADIAGNTALLSSDTDNFGQAAPTAAVTAPGSGGFGAGFEREKTPMTKTELALTICGWIWVAGIVCISAVTIYQHIKLKKLLATAWILRGNVYESEEIDTAFVMGVFNPKIYLPSGLPFDTQKAVLLHEQTHQARGDNVVKLVAFFALTMHWFNPLVWLAYKLACDDMEKSCDEAVIRGMTKRGYDMTSVKYEYGKMLVALGSGRWSMFSPASFAENETKARVKNAAAYKTGTAKSMIAAGLACFVILGAGIINPGTASGSPGLLIITLKADDYSFSSVSLPRGDEVYAAVMGYTGTEQNVTIPKTYSGFPVMAIADKAFENTDIVSVSVPDSVVYIGYHAFNNCRKLSSVIIPESVTDLGGGAFRDCAALRDIYLSNNITQILPGTFSNCITLKSINIPERVVLISSYAFNGSGVENDMKQKFASISDYDSDTDDIKNLYIGERYIRIEDFGFSSYSPVYDSRVGEIETVTIAGTVKHIGMDAFSGCNSLKSVVIEDGVRFIDADAFLFCGNLTSVSIPDSVITIADDAGLINDDKVSVTVYCSKGSYAQEWAEELHIDTVLSE